MRAHGLINLKTDIIPDGAHYVANEKPDFLVSLIGKIRNTLSFPMEES
jgi:hypothetical protein